MTQTKALNRSAAITGNWAAIPETGAFTFRFGHLDIGAWQFVLQSYQLLKVILDRSDQLVLKSDMALTKKASRHIKHLGIIGDAKI